MYTKYNIKPDLDYLNGYEPGFPKRIFWKVVAPKKGKLTNAQRSDVVFDTRDLKIRGLG